MEKMYPVYLGQEVSTCGDGTVSARCVFSLGDVTVPVRKYSTITQADCLYASAYTWNQDDVHKRTMAKFLGVAPTCLEILAGTHGQGKAELLARVSLSCAQVSPEALKNLRQRLSQLVLQRVLLLTGESVVGIFDFPESAQGREVALLGAA